MDLRDDPNVINALAQKKEQPITYERGKKFIEKYKMQMKKLK